MTIDHPSQRRGTVSQLALTIGRARLYGWAVKRAWEGGREGSREGRGDRRGRGGREGRGRAGVLCGAAGQSRSIVADGGASSAAAAAALTQILSGRGSGRLKASARRAAPHVIAPGTKVSDPCPPAAGEVGSGWEAREHKSPGT